MLCNPPQVIAKKKVKFCRIHLLHKNAILMHSDAILYTKLAATTVAWRETSCERGTLFLKTKFCIQQPLGTKQVAMPIIVASQRVRVVLHEHKKSFQRIGSFACRSPRMNNSSLF